MIFDIISILSAFVLIVVVGGHFYEEILRGGGRMGRIEKSVEEDFRRMQENADKLTLLYEIRRIEFEKLQKHKSFPFNH